MRYVLLLLLMPAILVAPNNLEVVPRVILRDGDARVTCRVPRDAANRAVTWGFEDYLADTRPLEGEDSRITWEAWFVHIPCESGDAFCRVVRSDGKVAEIKRSVVHAGCDP